MKLSGLCALVVLSACATTSVPDTQKKPESISNIERPDIEDTPIAAPIPEAVNPTTLPKTEAVPEPIKNVEPEIYVENAFKDVDLWAQADLTPALSAFKKTCNVWVRRKDETWLKTAQPDYGQYKDWREVCQRVGEIEANEAAAKDFFQTNFSPIKLQSDQTHQEGLLTAYYAPEIMVRLMATPEFSEPILARPKSETVQKLPRESLNVLSSKVLAYGRPIDVFFLQVQGSGRIKFADGTRYVVAFDGHNGHKYKSIGRVLIERGEMTRDEASKQAIEKWMENAGHVASQELMNQNPRYIFFKTEYVDGDLGPKGAMSVPLTAMGSLAVDNRYHPYGALIWLNTVLPQQGGDFTGAPEGLLVVAQDTGSAIKGRRRGDIYFGAGDAAGARAGVMKHKGVWTILLPQLLAQRVLMLRELAEEVS